MNDLAVYGAMSLEGCGEGVRPRAGERMRVGDKLQKGVRSLYGRPDGYYGCWSVIGSSTWLVPIAYSNL